MGAVQMGHVKRGYRAISFLAALNSDRLIFGSAIAAALTAGAFFTTL